MIQTLFKKQDILKYLQLIKEMEIISLLIRHTTEYDIHIDSVGSLACQIDSTHVQGTLMHLDMLVYSFVEGVQVGEG